MMIDNKQKRACLVYVTATEPQLEQAATELEAAGYAVCATKAELDPNLDPQDAQQILKDAIEACVAAADVCVFLLPNDENKDCEIGTAAGHADARGKRMLGIVAGERTSYPDVLEDLAPAMIRVGSDRLAAALDGEAIWEAPDRTLVKDRKITHVRCQ